MLIDCPSSVRSYSSTADAELRVLEPRREAVCRKGRLCRLEQRARRQTGGRIDRDVPQPLQDDGPGDGRPREDDDDHRAQVFHPGMVDDNSEAARSGLERAGLQRAARPSLLRLHCPNPSPPEVA